LWFSKTTLYMMGAGVGNLLFRFKRK